MKFYKKWLIGNGCLGGTVADTRGSGRSLRSLGDEKSDDSEKPLEPLGVDRFQGWFEDHNIKEVRENADNASMNCGRAGRDAADSQEINKNAGRDLADAADSLTFTIDDEDDAADDDADEHLLLE